MYDLNNPNGVVKEGDRFGYDYNLLARRGVLWANYSENFGPLHYSVSGKLGYDDMQRDGKMRNGMFPDGSYGKSETAHFLSGGFKFNSNIDVAPGSTLMLGIGYEMRGTYGFGYDPVFMVGEKSMAELTAEEKNAISHRGAALRELYKYLKERFGE